MKISHLLRSTICAAWNMESVNHAMQTRKDLRDYIAEKGMDPQRVLVPADGQPYSF